MVKRSKTNENQKTNPILWFLFAIVIPIIVAITLVVIILTMAGVNVADLAKDATSHIPGVSSIVKTDEEQQKEHKEENVKSVLKQKDEKIEELEQNVDDLESTLEKKEIEAEKKENKSSDGAKEESEKNAQKETENGKQQDSGTSMAASFKDMQPGKAALILEKMDDDQALALLDKLSNKARGDIFQEMEPELAATLTKKLMDQD